MNHFSDPKGYIVHPILIRKRVVARSHLIFQVSRHFARSHRSSILSFRRNLFQMSLNTGGTCMINRHWSCWWCRPSGGRFKNTYELLNLRALKISKLHKNYIFQCMGKIFCVEFQRVPLKFHTKYLTHTLKDVDLRAHKCFWNAPLYVQWWPNYGHVYIRRVLGLWSRCNQYHCNESLSASRPLVKNIIYQHRCSTLRRTRIYTK